MSGLHGISFHKTKAQAKQKRAFHVQMDDIILEINDGTSNKETSNNKQKVQSDESSVMQTKTTTLSQEEEHRMRKQAEDEWAEVERLQEGNM